MSLIKITDEMYNNVRRLYFLWKNLNIGIKEIYSRGINLPEAITEPICCYVNNFLLSLGRGSEDAIVPESNQKVQIKATSNWNSDLTSFGPKSEFDFLHFVRLNQREDKMYLYYIPVDTLKSIKVNHHETFEDQQLQGRRPRFSILNTYIIPNNLQFYAVVDLKSGDIKKY